MADGDGRDASIKRRRSHYPDGGEDAGSATPLFTLPPEVEPSDALTLTHIIQHVLSMGVGQELDTSLQHIQLPPHTFDPTPIVHVLCKVHIPLPIALFSFQSCFPTQRMKRGSVFKVRRADRIRQLPTRYQSASHLRAAGITIIAAVHFRPTHQATCRAQKATSPMCQPMYACFFIVHCAFRIL